jgi:hypothetical protein
MAAKIASFDIEGTLRVRPVHSPGWARFRKRNAEIGATPGRHVGCGPSPAVARRSRRERLGGSGMREEREGAGQEAERLADLVREGSREISRLIELEVALAKEEVRAAVGRQLRAASIFAFGGVFAFSSLAIMAWGGIYALALVLPIWLAVLIVGGFGVLVGLAVMLAGRAGLGTKGLRPEAAIESTRASVSYLVDRVRAPA